MVKRKPDIWVVIVIVIALGVIASTRASSGTLSPNQVIQSSEYKLTD